MDYKVFLDELLTYCHDDESRAYGSRCSERLYHTYQIVSGLDMRENGLDIGSFAPMSNLLADKLGANITTVELQDCNVEYDVLPYPENSFDFVLLTEVLEHLVANPDRVMRNIHQVLKTGGKLILTTPNASRLGNRIKLIFGGSIYDKYSQDDSPYRQYRRHNRLYTKGEVKRLLSCYFKVEQCYTKTLESHRNSILSYLRYVITRMLEMGGLDVGIHLIATARKNGVTVKFPQFLYRGSWHGCVGVLTDNTGGESG